MKTPPWIKMRKRSQVELPEEPPIWLGDHSNGEYFHFQTDYERKLRKFILQKSDENARKIGVNRRDFLASTMGMATSLYCINIASGCSSNETGHNVGSDGGSKPPPADAASRPAVCEAYQIEPELMYDEKAACAALSGDELIFDIQTHFFEPDGEWIHTNPGYVGFIKNLVGGDFGPDRYLELLFCDSDTTMAVLSCWPGALCSDATDKLYGMPNAPCGLPMSTEGAAAARDLINKTANSQRLLSHAMILPDDPAGVQNQLDIMERLACTTGVQAWKLYPAWGPSGVGFFLDDPDIGIPVIEKGLSLGVHTFCAHKGLPIPGFDKEHNVPTEVGRVASRYPDANFIIYHSAINANGSTYEGEYKDGDTTGVNSLITSLLGAGIGPNQNVYAELGSSFGQVMMDGVQAAHYIGKLLKYVGENNVLWGTDTLVSLVGGPPQVQIEALRKLTIPQDMQDQYGYPALTADIKAKIFGLNSAAVYNVDPMARRCQVNQCTVTTWKQQLDEEFGKRRFSFRTPMGPRTYAEYVRQGKEMIARGIPG